MNEPSYTGVPGIGFEACCAVKLGSSVQQRAGDAHPIATCSNFVSVVPNRTRDTPGTTAGGDDSAALANVYGAAVVASKPPPPGSRASERNPWPCAAKIVGQFALTPPG